MAVADPRDVLKADENMFAGRSAVAFQRFFNEGARYAMDPSGRGVMSEATRGQLGKDIYRELFEGPNQMMTRLNAGEMGQLSAALQQQGLGGRPLSTEDLKGLGGQNAQLDEAALRNVRKDQVVRNLQAYSGALNAIKEIFAEGGMSGTVNDMIHALEAISGGGMSQVGPAKLEMVARQFRNTSFNAGIPMPMAMMMLQRATEVSTSMGMNPMFATEATIGTFGFLGAINQQGLGAPMWGLSNEMKLGAMDTNLRLSAANSPLANRLGALARMGQAAGGFEGQAGQVLEMLRKNDIPGLQAMLKNGQLSEGAMARMMVQGSGKTINEATAFAAFRDTDANLEFVSRDGIMGPVRQLQRGEIYLNQITPALASRLMGSGLVQKQALGLAERISTRLQGINPESLATPELRHSVMQQILREEGGAFGLKGDARQLGVLGESLFGSLTSAVKEQLQTYGTLANMLHVQDPRAVIGGKEQVREASVQALMQSALAGIGQGGIVNRLLNTLGTSEVSRDPAAIKKILAKAIGFEDIGDVKDEGQKKAIEQAGAALVRIGELKKDLGTRTLALQTQLVDARKNDPKAVAGIEAELARVSGPLTRQLLEETKKLDSLEGGPLVKMMREYAEAKARLEGKDVPDKKEPLVLKGELLLLDARTAQIDASGTPEGGAGAPPAGN